MNLEKKVRYLLDRQEILDQVRDIFESSPQLNTRYSEHRSRVTGDGQRRGARRDDGVSLSDERGLKNGFGKPLCNESAGDKGTCSRTPEDLGAALRCTAIGTRRAMTAAPAAARCIPSPPGRVANTADKQ